MKEEIPVESVVQPSSLYELSTGNFTGLRIGGSSRFVASNVPEGMGAISGVFDPMSQRVENSKVLDYQPPQPDEDHVWIHDDEHGNRVRRWVKKPEVVERENVIAQAKAEILRLESMQPRAQRDAALYGDRSRLVQIEQQILEQRQIIHENTLSK